MQGTPWYSPLSNHFYAHGFMYIGAAVEDRTDLIEDGIVYSEQPALQNKYLEEQSDLVVVLLNLHSIPKRVIE